MNKIGINIGVNVVGMANHQTFPWEPDLLACEEVEMMNRFFHCQNINKVVNAEARLKIEYPYQLQMNQRYRGENIHYASLLERFIDFQIFTYEGKLYNANGSLVNTPEMDFDTGAMLVMDFKGNLFLTNKIRGQHHHSSFLAGAPVSYASMVEVKEGIIVEEELWSGHYQPDQLSQAQFQKRLQESNYVVSFDKSLIAVIFRNMHYEKKKENPTCMLSRLPLLHPIKLPCGHTFNKEPFLKWLANRSVCPLDNERTRLEECHEERITEGEMLSRYRNESSKILAMNQNFDTKILEQDLDHWNSRSFTLASKSKFGFYLFLKKETPFQTIGDILNRLGETYQFLHTGGRDIRDLSLAIEKMSFRMVLTYR